MKNILISLLVASIFGTWYIPEQPIEPRSVKAIEVDETVEVPVLIYHRVGPGTNPLTVWTEEFEKQMQYLSDNGFVAIDMKTVRYHIDNNIPFPDKTVVITFDDAYSTVYTAAYPILKKSGLRASLYAPTAFIGIKYHTTWNQLREMQQSGVFTIVSHSHHHRRLTELSDYEVNVDLQTPMLNLEENLNVPIEDFAYPYGNYNNHVIELLQDAGYKSALTTEHRCFVPSNDSIYEVPRLYVNYATTIEEFADMVNCL